MTLTNFPFDPLLDLAPWVGQRQASFRFELANRVSGINLGEIHPIRGATLSHDTGRIIKRQLTVGLGTTDAALINPVTDMITVIMTFPEGSEYPLGEYVFTDASYQRFTSGRLGNLVLSDKMFIVDQQIEKAFTSRRAFVPAYNNDATSISGCLNRILSDLPIQFEIEATTFSTVDSWPAGTMRGQILEALALTGDYFSPWFDNNGVLRFIRAFNPATRIPDFDWDTGNQVLRSSIVESSNVLTAPNRFIVISNASNTPQAAVYGSADVPVNAPHSKEARGFVIPHVVDLQALTKQQCQATAENLVQRQTVFETVQLTTAPDPRHDSYNIIQWQGEPWLELSWGMTLTEGQPMTHTLRKAYL